MPTLLALLLACSPDGGTPAHSGDPGTTDDSGGPHTVDWQRALAPASDLATAPRGFVLQRAIVHLHSPWSHDACDGDPLDEDGAPRRDCLADLRSGLCDAGIDHAFLTDHPSHFATGEWDEVLLADEGDTLLPSAADARVLEHPCADGRRLRWYPGVEDELMPVALDRHVPGDAAERDATYNTSDADTLAAYQTAGALSLVAHTEGRDVETLRAQVQAGLAGVEVFNLHAMFDPNIRSEDLGLDASSWLAEIAPFTSQDGTAEPDLFVLAVLANQPPSEAAWDALNVDGPEDRVVIGVAGTDAHQNVFPIPLRDGERGDSYRRMLRWFSQHLWMDPADLPDAGGDLDAAERTLAAGRFHVAFEILGTPDGFDFHLEDAAGGIHEMGSILDPSVLPAELVVTCPTLSAGSPQGTDAPEISATVYRDGAPWQTSCGRFPVDDAGTYRVRVDMVPWHLAPFLGDDAADWMHAYPWVYGNPVRIRP
ncbi:MAG: hypothetical protein H6742_04890 [Alphaproteobacteria bacterium]|nr:hypothetical protein [Alphaproteobacteria bacterium]